MDTQSVNSPEAEGAASGRPPQAAAAGAPCPALVIRGTREKGNGQRTRVDYLSISCTEDGGAISDCLASVFEGAPGAGPVYEHGPGKRHFEKSRRVLIAGMPAGLVLTGGESQRGRACVDVSGVGCGFIRDWEKAQEAFLGLPERSWRRGDIAADFFGGQLTHEQVIKAHAEGKFMRGGRDPVLTEVRTTDKNLGRTIYVGKRGGDALGRFYEKGKKEFSGPSYSVLRRVCGSPEGITVTDSELNEGEAFDLASWYRAELELRSKNRPIPDDWIVRRDEYFAGAYPFLAELLPGVEPCAILRPRDQGILAIERALERVKAQWGAVLHTGLAYVGGDYVELCRRIVGEKHSARLIEAGALLVVGEAQ